MSSSSTGRESVAPMSTPGSTPRNKLTSGALFALAVLFSMNLLNYIDRYVFFAVGNDIQTGLKIDDRGYGYLSVAFMVVYTIVSPIVGWMGDRYSRKMMLFAGVGIWSVATVGTAFSHDFWHMFFWRALLGIGEASYGVIAPALLSDLFQPRHRGRVMGLYYLALPVGGAIGYGVGGLVSAKYGWESAFLVVGIPGLVVAALALVIRDPGRGASEGHAAAGKADRPKPRDYLDLFSNRTFLYNTAGMAAVTFATGAIAAWGSTFYQRVQEMSSVSANKWIGVLTAIAGLLGISLGTYLADYFLKFTRRAYLLLATVAVTAAAPIAFVAIIDPNWQSSLAFLFVSMVLIASVLGPCNSITANVVPATQRAAGYALSIFLLHLFGDISSPVVVAFISEFFGRPTVAGSSIGRILSLGTRPLPSPTGPTNLTVGMLSVIPILGLGAFFFLLGSRHLPDDQEKARALGGDVHPDAFVH